MVVGNKPIVRAKVPPHSIEAEQSVLGALMLDHRAWDRVVDRISVEDFYRNDHRLIFRAMHQLANQNKPFDVLTVSEVLRQQNSIDAVNGEAYLYELAQNTPSAANIVAYADIVRERSVLRQLIETGSDIVDHAFGAEDNDIQTLLEDAERRVFQIAEQRSRGSGPVEISKLLTEATERIDHLYHSTDALTGLETGFTDFDDMTSGLQAGDLIIVAGRPSMGKTVFGVNIAEHAAIKGDKPVLIFSLEMPSVAITLRMLSSLGRIEQHKVRSGKLSDHDWPRLTSAVSMLSEAKLFVDDTPALSPAEVRARARRLVREQGPLGLIVVDYLQLMQVPGSKENRTAEISEISRTLKTIAKEMNVPMIALSQLNRSLESRHDRRPVMSDLRESGAIEQDADIIAFIYRDEVYNEDTPDKGIAEILVRKHRNGPIGEFRLKFSGHYTRFDNLAAQSDEPQGAYA